MGKTIPYSSILILEEVTNLFLKIQQSGVKERTSPKTKERKGSRKDPERLLRKRRQLRRPQKSQRQGVEKRQTEQKGLLIHSCSF